MTAYLDQWQYIINIYESEFGSGGGGDGSGVGGGGGGGGSSVTEIHIFWRMQIFFVCVDTPPFRVQFDFIRGFVI